MPRMTLEVAEEYIRRVKVKAAELGVQMAIAVVDEAGKLVAYARMGGKRASFGERLAIAKARTAVAYGRDTKSTMEHFSNRPGNYYIVGMAALYPGEFWAGPGGAPIKSGDEVIGGLGVSGSAPELDHRCVTEALKDLNIV